MRDGIQSVGEVHRRLNRRIQIQFILQYLAQSAPFTEPFLILQVGSDLCLLLTQKDP